MLYFYRTKLALGGFYVQSCDYCRSVDDGAVFAESKRFNCDYDFRHCWRCYRRARFYGTINTLIGGMGGNAETALSYILLGTLAVAISRTKIVEFVAQNISKLIKNKRALFVFIITGIGCFSQNLIPVHIAYIPILIPPLLGLMNAMKLDRRAMACGLTFSVKWPYVALPV